MNWITSLIKILINRKSVKDAENIKSKAEWDKSWDDLIRQWDENCQAAIDEMSND